MILARIKRALPSTCTSLTMLLLMAAVVTTACESDGELTEEDALSDTMGVDIAADTDQGVTSCDPACTGGVSSCVDGVCECAEGYHEGGGAGVPGCVAEGSCHPGFGIPQGGSECVPVTSFCQTSETRCDVPNDWAEGECRYIPAPDGAACVAQSSDPCVDAFTCVSGACEPVPPSCSDLHRPIIFVHGINGSSDEFETMRGRLVAAGWPEDYLYSFDAVDPAWGCNKDNATAIATLVAQAIADTCEPRVDIVAHSMGTLSSRYFIKALGGAELVNTYVTLGGPHHGLSSPCWAPDFLGVCVWQELCETGGFITDLNADPSTPGQLSWVSIYGTADATIPNASSHLDGAENVAIDGAEHAGDNGLLEREDVFAAVLRVLSYPCW